MVSFELMAESVVGFELVVLGLVSVVARLGFGSCFEFRLLVFIFSV